MVTVSIALATYNGEKYLRRQLESLAWQERAPDQLVACDDRSQDATIAILRSFAETAPFPTRIIENERGLGFRRNFLKAAHLCASEVILFCDQDDVWRPGKVAAMARAFDEDPALLLAYHNASVVDADEHGLSAMANPAEEQAALALEIPPPWHFARGLVQGFRRDLLAFDDLWPLTREHFDGEHLGHDRWYFFLALTMGRIRFLDEDLLMYRQHGANLFGSDCQLRWRDRIAERLRHDPPTDVLRATGARSRAAVLRALRPRIGPDAHPRLDRLAQRYDVLADRLDRRLSTYTGRSLPDRAASLLRSARGGDYCGNPWGFDPRSILRDAWSGVVRGSCG
jgi:glycosyltransferase involved in cell wall biosynthesis